MTREEILDQLMEGNNRFAENLSGNKLPDKDQRAELVKGQNPYAVVLSCSDSRVVPEYIFDAGLGELFVIRIAGNIANKSSIASIEYAVSQLNTKVVLVLGHQNCGAVQASVKGSDLGENLNHLLSHLNPVNQASSNNPELEELVKLNAKETALKLVNNSKIIRDAEASGDLQILSGYYHLNTGKVEFL